MLCTWVCLGGNEKFSISFRDCRPVVILVLFRFGLGLGGELLTCMGVTGEEFIILSSVREAVSLAASHPDVVHNCGRGN